MFSSHVDRLLTHEDRGCGEWRSVERECIDGAENAEASVVLMNEVAFVVESHYIMCVVVRQAAEHRAAANISSEGRSTKRVRVSLATRAQRFPV